MFVLGIDPGVSRCGYGCVEQSGPIGRAVAVGVLTTPPSDPLPRRLASLAVELEALLADLRPQVVAVERLFFQANVRTGMSVGQASGLVLAAAQRAGRGRLQRNRLACERLVREPRNPINRVLEDAGY